MGNSLSHKISVVTSIILLLFSFSCKKENRGDCFKSAGTVIEEIREFSGIDSVEIEKYVDVIFIQDTVEKVIVKTGQNLLPLLKTFQIDKKLYIQNHNTCDWVRSYKTPYEVYIHVKNLKGINANGTGKIYSENKLSGDYLRISNTAMSDINLDLNYKDVIVYVFGFGNLNLKGSAGMIDAFLGGSCNVDFKEIPCAFGYISTSSTGDTYINPFKELGVNIRGRGNVFYTGNPQIVRENYTDKGRLIKIN
jgi:hypothetical protein